MMESQKTNQKLLIAPANHASFQTQVVSSQRKRLKMAKSPFPPWVIAFGTSKLNFLKTWIKAHN